VIPFTLSMMVARLAESIHCVMLRLHMRHALAMPADNMSPIEIVAVLLGIANILLIIRRSVWNYPFGIAMVTLYFFIFRDAKLYSDAGLQIFFVVVNLYGWWSWSRNRAEAGEVVVQRLGTEGLLAWIAGSAVATLGWGFVMSRYTDASYPFWDAGVAMLSVAGQILMTRRYLENWYWWIAVNAISIPLYIVKNLQLTAGLYALFLILAAAGLLQWRKAGRSHQFVSREGREDF
jgi:nicotinamide mononucleotide transporter